MVLHSLGLAIALEAAGAAADHLEPLTAKTVERRLRPDSAKA